jgi:DNA-directed RNA polymerase subunit RPC12/RpoP
MPRLIAILLMLIAGIGLARWLSLQNRREDNRANKTFRPRRPSPFANFRDANHGSNHGSNHNEANANAGASNDIYAMPQSSVTSVCDALTGAPINTSARVWRCVKCQSLYHQASVTALEKDNDGACVQCNSRNRAAVTFTDD